MSNLTILERNIIDCLGVYEDHDSVVRHFLSAIDRCGVLKAERMANEFGTAMEKIRPMVDFSATFHGADESVTDDVCEFIQERLLNYRGGGNMKLMKAGA